MSYMRGMVYVWSDNNLLHLWSATGNDEWKDSAWAVGRDRKRASGIVLQTQTFDELVVMRLAQLLESGGLPEAVNSALEKHNGNTGCQPLVRQADKIKALA